MGLTDYQGFIADHRDIELLKLRKFTVSKKIPDDLLCADDTQDKVTEILRPLVGFVGSWEASRLESITDTCRSPFSTA